MGSAIFHFDEKQLESPQSFTDLLTQRNTKFKKEFLAGVNSLNLAREHSLFVDGLIKHFALASGVDFENAAIFALGGYGREELGLHSDIDLLFLCENPDAPQIKKLTDKILYPFWNNRIEIGGATRTVSECKTIFQQDVRTLSAALDARLLLGDSKYAQALNSILLAQFTSKSSKRQFVLDKLAEQKQRWHRFGDSVYLLQPNIKEGEGGLREVQLADWLNRYVLQEASSKDDLSHHQAVLFLWSVRHALHVVQGKRQDRLIETLQSKVAELLNFTDKKSISASEQLMQRYYKSAALIHQNNARVLERAITSTAKWKFLNNFKKKKFGNGFYQTAGGKLAAKETVFIKNSHVLLDIFCLAQKHQLEINAQTKELLIAYANKLNAKDFQQLWKDPVIQQKWQQLWSNPRHLSAVLQMMQECGHLVKWYPELKPIINRIQHNGYHFFTIDAHSIRTLTELEEICGNSLQTKFSYFDLASADVLAWQVLTLGCFLHDIGKARGGEHSQIGAELAEAIAKRIGYSAQHAREVNFLVLSHLLMPKLSFRRDLSDNNLIERFANALPSTSILSSLYLLTVADIRAVGPGVWTPWKASLLAQLYLRTRAYLTESKIKSSAEEIKTTKIDALIKAGFAKSFLQNFLLGMPENYLLSISLQDLIRQLKMLKLLDSNPVLFSLQEDEKQAFSDFEVITNDFVGLFARIAGVLSLHDYNIVEAKLFTSQEGVAVDIIRITDAQHNMVRQDDQFFKMQQDLQDSLQNETKFTKTMSRMLASQPLNKSAQKKHFDLIIDNDISAADTVLEIHTYDSHGLLYRLTTALVEMDLSIQRAYITTQVDRVIDVFYIRNTAGQKITSQEQLNEIHDKLNTLFYKSKEQL